MCTFIYTTYICLYTSGHLEQRAVHEQMDTLIMKLSEMEVEVYQLAESKYINFRPNLETAEGLLQRVQDAENEISTLQRKITTEVQDFVLFLSLTDRVFHCLCL